MSTVQEHRLNGLCGLCQVAWEARNNIASRQYGVIEDFHSWWYGDRFRFSMSGFDNVCVENDRPDMQYFVDDDSH